MAKGLPYFKFVSTEWLTGNISYESFEVQGLFINICALYWQRDGKLELSEVEYRYKKKSLIAKLTPRFFLVIDGFIIIKFLDEQLVDRLFVSKTNSDNGKKGGRPPLEEKKPKKSNIEEEKEEEVNKNKKKITQHLFEDSEFFDFEKFQEQFKGTDYEFCDLKIYYEKIKNWSAGKGAKKIDWIATARNFILSDKQAGKLQLKNGVTHDTNKTSIGTDLDELIKNRYGDKSN